MCCGSWGRKESDTTEQLNWTELNFCFIGYPKSFGCVDYSIGNFLEMGVPDCLTYPLRNLHVGQEVTVRTRYETTDRFQIGKGVQQSCILSPCLFNLYAEYIILNSRHVNHKREQGFQDKYQQPQICRWHQSNGRKWRGIKEPLDEGERGKWKIWLENQH